MSGFNPSLQLPKRFATVQERTSQGWGDSRIAVEIKANGESSRFRRVGRSTFTINNGVVPDAPAVTPAPKTDTRRPGTLSFADAAEQVLRQFGKRQPVNLEGKRFKLPH